MTREELLKELEKLPKIETNNSISAMNAINVDDLMSAVDRFNKIPNYNDLLKENQELKKQLEECKDKMKEELKHKTIKKMMDNPKKLVNGALTIGYDLSKERNHCCLIVARLRGNSEVMIINEFYDKKANELFKKLVGGK